MRNANEEEKIILDNNEEIFKKLTNVIQYILIKHNDNSLNKMIKEYFQNFSQEDYSDQDNYIKKLEKLIKDIENFIKDNDKLILQEDNKFNNAKEYSLNWKKNIISEINEKFNSKREDMINWVIYEKIHYDNEKNQFLFTFKNYKKLFSNCIVNLFTFYPYNNEDKYTLKYTNKWEEEEFENYI